MGMSIGSWPRRFEDSANKEGLWRFVLRAALSPVYRQAAVRFQPLDHEEKGEALLDSRPVTLHTATEGDAEALHALRPDYSRDTVRSRLRAGQECLLVLAGADIGSLRWVSRDFVPMQYLGLALPLYKNELCIYELFTNPAYRGKGVRVVGWEALRRRFLAEQRDTVVDYVIPGRRPYGVDPRLQVAMVHTLRVGPFRKFWVRTWGPQAGYWQERLKELRWA
jgi:hypothetical protein